MKRKIILISIILLCIISCKPIIPPPPLYKTILPYDECFPNIGLQWIKDSITITELYQINSNYYIENFKDYVLVDKGIKNIFIKNDLIYTNINLDTTCFYIVYRSSATEELYCRILRNKVLSLNISKGSSSDNVLTSFDQYGNIAYIYISYLDLNNQFNKGCGMYRDFDYYKIEEDLKCKDKEEMERISSNRINEASKDSIQIHQTYYIPINDTILKKKQTVIYLKEIGEIKNNYKVGEWKYYNPDGSIKKIQKYKLKDKVDVRFPYCLFNKKE